MFSPVPSRGTNVARGDCVDVWIEPLEDQRWRQMLEVQQVEIYRSSAHGANFVNDSGE